MADPNPDVVEETAEKIQPERAVRSRPARTFRFPPLISFKEIVRRIRKFNFYRILREKAVRWYLLKMVACPAKGLLVCWQPLYFIIIKTGVAVTLSLLLYSAYPYLAGWLKEGLAFFRLNEIYNFTFPEQEFFDHLAQGILLVIIGYYGLFFIAHQVLGLFSSFAVSSATRKAYYIRSFFVKKDLHVFAVPALDYFAIRHNLVFRILGVGTLILKNRSGEKIKIRWLTRASRAVRKMSLLKRKKGRGSGPRLKDPWDEV